MYSVLRAPCICTKGIGFHENRMIDVAADPRANCGTDPTCMDYQLFYAYMCIPILIHRKDPRLFLLFPCLSLPNPSQLTTFKEFRGM